MAGLAGSQFSAAQRGPGYAEYSAWAASVEGNPIYSEKNQSDFIYYSMMGINDPVNLDQVNDFLQSDDQQANFLVLHYSGRTIHRKYMFSRTNKVA